MSKRSQLKDGYAGAADDTMSEPGAVLEAALAAPNTSGLSACTEDARQAALDGDRGPADPTDYTLLRARLDAVRIKFPPLYRQDFVDPYLATLDALGRDQFAEILIGDPERQSTGGTMLDMAQAILQRGEQYQLQATNAFQEVVGDLYDGFLSAQDRKGINPPDRATTPPLVKWGNPAFGPYTWPLASTVPFGARASVVSLPPANTRIGLMAWAALGHETGGHDILSADVGLRNDLASAVQQQLSDMGDDLADYWSSRIDETASDVMGILNMGPAAAIGVIAYFRGIRRAGSGGQAALSNNGPSSDPHPADIVRGYLAAATVALLPFGQSAAWSATITAETDRDVKNIVLAGRRITKDKARESAARVAKAIATTRTPSLENHSLDDIQTWRDADEQKVRIVRQALTTTADLPQQIGTGRIYAAHIVAGAVMEALGNPADIPIIFNRMISILAQLHAANPVWSPLLVRQPGNIVRDFAYLPAHRIAVGGDEEADAGDFPADGHSGRGH